MWVCMLWPQRRGEIVCAYKPSSQWARKPLSRSTMHMRAHADCMPEQSLVIYRTPASMQHSNQGTCMLYRCCKCDLEHVWPAWQGLLGAMGQGLDLAMFWHSHRLMKCHAGTVCKPSPAKELVPRQNSASTIAREV